MGLFPNSYLAVTPFRPPVWIVGTAPKDPTAERR